MALYQSPRCARTESAPADHGRITGAGRVLSRRDLEHVTFDRADEPQACAGGERRRRPGAIDKHPLLLDRILVFYSGRTSHYIRPGTWYSQLELYERAY